jgi:hypothetical protein
MARIFKNILPVLLFLLPIFRAFAAQGTAQFSFRQESPNVIIVEVSIPEPQFLKNGETGFKKQVNPGEGAFELGNGALYGFSKMMLLPEGTRFEVLKNGNPKVLKTGDLDFHFAEDSPILPETNISQHPNLSASKKSFKNIEQLLKTEAPVELQFLGKMRGEPISSLLLKPYSFKNGEVRFFTALTIRLTLPSAATIREITQSPSAVFSKRSFKKTEKNSAKPLSTSFLKTIPAAPDGYNYKIIINKEGLVRVSAEELAGAGMDLENIDTQTLKIWNKGAEIPIYIYDRNNQKLDVDGLTPEYIEFFAEPNRQYFKNRDGDIFGDPETDENVYALTWGGALGKRMVEESGDIKITDQSRMTDLRGQSFKSTVFVEQNNLFERFGGNYSTKDTNQPSFQGDQHFWGRIPANQSATFPVQLPHPDLLDDGEIKLTAMFHGATDLLNNFSNCSEKFEHNAEVYLNQRRVLKTSWPGIQKFSAGSDAHGLGTIPMTAASAAENSVITISNVFNCVSQTEVVPSFYVNWLQVSYQRLYKAFKNTMPFAIPEQGESGLYTFYLSEFTRPDVVIYRKGISRIVNFGTRIIKADETVPHTRYTFSFQSYVASPEEEFYAVSTDQLLKAKSIVRDKATSLAEFSNDFDYIIITDTALYNPLLKEDANANNPVVQFRNFKNDHGFKVLIANISDINDEFNFGVKSKESIRRFLKHAYNEWSVAPRYAVIAGDASAIVPDHWQTVRWGTTPTDYTYGLIDGFYRGSKGEVIDDPFPEILVGRIPASTKEQMMAVVEKCITYSESPDLEFYRSSTVLIAGSNPLFENQTDKLAEKTPSSVSVRRLFVLRHTGKYFGGTNELISEINSGAAFVNYMGHGGGAVWEDSGLMVPEDTKRLSNKGRYCVVSSPTCFTGAYENVRGLLTSLLFEREKGAIVAWGNSGFGWEENSFQLANGHIESFFLKENRGKNIGDLFTEGKARYFAQSGGYANAIALTMLLQCNYLGDPALKFGIAENQLQIESTETTIDAGKAVTFKGNAPFSSGQGFAELFDTDNNLIPGTQQELTIQNGAFSGNFSVPAQYSGSGIGLRVYANDFTTSNEAEGSLLFSSESLVFIDVSVSPFPVLAFQPFDLVAKIRSQNFVGNISAIIEFYLPDGNVVLDTIPMTGENGSFKTNRQIPGTILANGTRINYFFEANDSFKTINSKLYSFTVGGRADPAAFAQTKADSISHVTGTRAINPTFKIYPTPQGAHLGAYIYNWSGTDATNVEVIFTNSAVSEVIGTTFVQIPAFGKTLATVPVQPNTFNPQNIRVSIPFKTAEDASGNNNSVKNSVLLSCFMVAPGIGSTNNGSSYSSVGINGLATIEVPNPGTISTPELLCLRADTLIATSQPGIQFLKSGEYSAFTLELSNPVAEVRGVLKLWYDAANPDIGSATPAIYKYNTRSKTWSRMSSVIQIPGIVAADVLLKGTFAVGYSNDFTAPNTRISIEGQFFTNNGAVPPSPKISVVATDENGIQAEAENIVLELDSKRVLKEDFTFVDSAATPTSSGILYKPVLSNGNHTFCISVMDNNGNQSERNCIQMTVSNEFQVRVLGEFPNPFENEMFLAYDILGANSIDEVEVKFFSASGRAIRTLKYPSSNFAQTLGLTQGGTGEPTSIGYHEVWWDGLDDDGSEVANGVYFYRIRIKSGDELVETLGKIARVR